MQSAKCLSYHEHHLRRKAQLKNAEISLLSPYSKLITVVDIIRELLTRAVVLSWCRRFVLMFRGGATRRN